MTYTPKFQQQYEQELLGIWHALSGVVDLAEGSPDRQLAASIASVFESFDARLLAMVKAHGFDAAGQDLDDRVASIMSAQAVQRAPASASSGAAIQVRRRSTLTELEIPAGCRYRSTLDPSQEYVQIEAVTMAIGQSVYPSPSQSPISVVSVYAGKRSQAPVNTIRQIVPGTGVPTDVYDVTNVVALTNGDDRESDKSLRQRAKLVLAGVAKNTPPAMRGLASRFTATDGTVIRQARLIEPADKPGYSELVVSDGFGLQGRTRPAVTRSGTVGANGTQLLFFDGPAASEPWLSIDGGAYLPAGDVTGAVVIHERGYVEFIDGYGLAEGQTYSIGGHIVYTGAIAELQDKIEGDQDAIAVLDNGWRAAGTRVRVRPSILQPLAFTIRAAFRGDPDTGKEATSGEIISFLSEYDLGEPLNLFKLTVDVGDRLPDVLDDFEILAPAVNISPISQRHQFFTTADLIGYL